MENFYKNNGINYNINNPYFLYTTLSIDHSLQQQMIATVESQIETGDYNGGYTFVVEESDQEFSILYNTFKHICNTVFENLDISIYNRTICWANVYNKNTYRSNLHHHLRTSSINSVFYLQVPIDKMENSCGLRVITKDHLDQVFIPEELDLVIMPSWMPHEPLPHNSQFNRIAINMEIACNQKIDDFYTLNKIYKNCKINVE
jgi:hypothetical protein